MTDPRVLSLAELHAIAARLAAASRSVKVPRALRTDLALVSSLLSTLLRTGVINEPDNPQRCHQGRDSLACDRSLETDSLKLTCLKSHRDLKEGRFTPALFRVLAVGAQRDGRLQHYRSKWLPDFLNRKSFLVRFVVHFLNCWHPRRNMIRGFCAESGLQPERCSSCGSANSQSDDARFEHGSLRLVGADLDFLPHAASASRHVLNVGALRHPIGSHQMPSI